MHSSINLFFFFSLLVILFNPKNMRPLLLSSSLETKLSEFHSLPYRYLKFLGDSHLQDRDIALTIENIPTNAPKSSGVVLYNHPILSVDPHSKKVPSFYTMFAFSIQNVEGDEKALGDGLTFLISPNGNLLGSPGYLGLVDSTDLTRNRFVAIEFDTKCDPMFHDPDDNHVGLNINSLFSIKLATSSSLGVNLKSGALISTWIDYTSYENRLEVFVSSSFLKPIEPILKVEIDLSDYFKENAFVGFSAGAEQSMQLTRIAQWEFKIVGFSPPPPPPLGSGGNFPNPSESGHKHSHLSRIAVGLIIGVCSVPFLALFVWFFWKKLIWMIQKSDGVHNLETQTIKSSGVSRHEVILLVLVDNVARGLNIEKVLDNEAELNIVKTVKSSKPPCSSLPAVKPRILPLRNAQRTNDISSI